MAAAKYASDDLGESDRSMRVCAEAGRKCVRNIQQYPILSPEWIQLVDSLKSLTRLIQLETRLPADAKVDEIHGRNRESEGTLWDQSSHENAIRILVEEAKVNLCLRMMNEFKIWQYDDGHRARTQEVVVAQGIANEAQVSQKCKQFEESMGILLWRAFSHVETLQLIDIPLLIEHCALILVHCERHRAESLGCQGKEQELFVMHYVASLFKHAEALNSVELLAKVRELNVLQLSVLHVLRHSQGEYSLDASHDMALGLAALCDNEDFQTGWMDFFVDESGQQNNDLMNQFCQLKTVLVDPILAASPEKKRELRPLTDFFNLLGRKMR